MNEKALNEKMHKITKKHFSSVPFPAIIHIWLGIQFTYPQFPNIDATIGYGISSPKRYKMKGI